jgi:hypothetical protein
VIATGIMMAMIDIGPRPGSMPMKVPIRQPPITISRLVSEKAVVRPIRKPSIIAASQEAGQRAQEDAEHLLHQPPDRAGGESRDRNQDMQLALAEDQPAARKKRRRRAEKAERTQQRA